jgi:hypothetical protein
MSLSKLAAPLLSVLALTVGMAACGKTVGARLAADDPAGEALPPLTPADKWPPDAVRTAPAQGGTFPGLYFRWLQLVEAEETGKTLDENSFNPDDYRTVMIQESGQFTGIVSVAPEPVGEVLVDVKGDRAYPTRVVIEARGAPDFGQIEMLVDDRKIPGGLAKMDGKMVTIEGVHVPGRDVGARGEPDQSGLVALRYSEAAVETVGPGGAAGMNCYCEIGGIVRGKTIECNLWTGTSRGGDGKPLTKKFIPFDPRTKIGGLVPANDPTVVACQQGCPTFFKDIRQCTSWDRPPYLNR